MTLKKTILLAFAAISVVSASANAYITPGGPRPPAPYPEPGYPGNPGHGQTVQRSVVLNTRVINSSIDVLQAVGIGYEFNGYQVESVIVDMRGSQPGTELSLLADGYTTSSVYSPQGRVILRPSNRAILGQDLRSLQISVRGLLDLTGITVNLIQASSPGYPGNPGPGYPGPGPGYPGNPGNPGYSEKVDLGINISLYGNDRLDITRYIDMRRYRGYRINKIEITASAVYNSSLFDVMINGFNQGPSIQLDNRRRIATIRPQNAVLGQGADSIVLTSRGDTNVHRVVLRLSR